MGVRLAQGWAQVAGHVVAADAVGDRGALRIGGDAGPVLRPVGFAERSRIVHRALVAAVPCEELAAELLRAATLTGGDVESAVAEILALHLAGAGSGGPCFADSVLLLARSLGWGPEALEALDACEVDRLAGQLRDAVEPGDVGWQRVVFENGDERDADSLDDLRASLTDDLLMRAMEVPSQSSITTPSVPQWNGLAAASLTRTGSPAATQAAGHGPAPWTDATSVPRHGAPSHDEPSTPVPVAWPTTSPRTVRADSPSALNGSAASTASVRRQEPATSAPPVEVRQPPDAVGGARGAIERRWTDRAAEPTDRPAAQPGAAATRPSGWRPTGADESPAAMYGLVPLATASVPPASPEPPPPVASLASTVGSPSPLLKGVDKSERTGGSATLPEPAPPASELAHVADALAGALNFVADRRGIRW